MGGYYPVCHEVDMVLDSYKDIFSSCEPQRQAPTMQMFDAGRRVPPAASLATIDGVA